MCASRSMATRCRHAIFKFQFSMGGHWGWRRRVAICFELATDTHECGAKHCRRPAAFRSADVSRAAERSTARLGATGPPANNHRPRGATADCRGCSHAPAHAASEISWASASASSQDTRQFATPVRLFGALFGSPGAAPKLTRRMLCSVPRHGCLPYRLAWGHRRRAANPLRFFWHRAGLESCPWLRGPRPQHGLPQHVGR